MEKKYLLPAFLLLSLLSINAPAVNSQASFTWDHWDRNILFKLPYYDSVLAFNENYTMTNFIWSGLNASSIIFSGLDMGYTNTAPAQSYFAITSGNVTLLRVYKDYELQFLVQGSGNSNVTVSSANGKTRPVRVEINNVAGSEGTDWIYDEVNNRVTVILTDLDAGTKNVLIAWAGEGIGSGFVLTLLTISFFGTVIFAMYKLRGRRW